jgi:hypothetical protein
MARQQGKAGAKTKGTKRLKVKKQPLKDLEARKGMKGGARRAIVVVGG